MWHRRWILVWHKTSCLFPIIYFNGCLPFSDLSFTKFFRSFFFFIFSNQSHYHLGCDPHSFPQFKDWWANVSVSFSKPFRRSCSSSYECLRRRDGPTQNTNENQQNFMLSFACNEPIHSTPSAAHCLSSSTYGSTFSSLPRLFGKDESRCDGSKLPWIEAIMALTHRSHVTINPLGTLLHFRMKQPRAVFRVCWTNQIDFYRFVLCNFQVNIM